MKSHDKHNHEGKRGCCGGGGCGGRGSHNKDAKHEHEHHEEHTCHSHGHEHNHEHDHNHDHGHSHEQGHEHGHGHCGCGHDHHGHDHHGQEGHRHDEDLESQFEELDQEEQIIQLKSDVKSLTDKLMRALAEIQNGKRIADKEKADALKYGVSKFAKDILVIRDTLKLALANADETNPIVDGVKKVLDIFDKTMDNHGVKPVEAEGIKFDPNLHQAIMEVESDLESGMVVQVMQDGFVIGDRLLRPAMVTVSKGKN